MVQDAVNPTLKTLKRRARELAAASCSDDNAEALLLFYSAECGLKALYMSRNSMRNANDANAMPAARSYGHKLDQLISVLKIPPSALPLRPTGLTLRNGARIAVADLHQAWRYGERIVNHPDVVTWLKSIISYTNARL